MPVVAPHLHPHRPGKEGQGSHTAAGPGPQTRCRYPAAQSKHQLDLQGVEVRKFSRKTTIIAASMALVVATSVVAYAFWTNEGAGTGEASTGTNTVQVNQLSVVTGLVPDGDPQELSGDFNNLTGSTVHVNDVTAEITDVPAGTDPTKPPCEVDDFALTGNPTLINEDILTGSNVGDWDDIFIQLVNNPAKNQDNCKNVTVEITYSTD
jgi:hypothetical protein